MLILRPTAPAGDRVAVGEAPRAEGGGVRRTLAWVSAVVGLLLAAEYLLLEPIRREMERWRADGGGAA